MLVKRIFACMAILICLLLAVGCGGDDKSANKPADKPAKPAEQQTDTKKSLTTVTLNGDKTKLIMELPFDIPNEPKDELGSIPPELKEIILKAISYRAGTSSFAASVSCSTFSDDIISQITEADLYEALNQEMQSNFTELKNNPNFKDMKTSYQKTQVDNCPAYIATATYVNEKDNELKSTLVYLFKGSDMWRIIFDYRQSDDDTIKTVDNAVNSIKLQ